GDGPRVEDHEQALSRGAGGAHSLDGRAGHRRSVLGRARSVGPHRERRAARMGGAVSARRIVGFTLVEMLVALALVALMSLAMLQAYRFSQRTLAQVTRLDGGVREVAGAQRLLRRLMEQAYPY